MNGAHPPAQRRITGQMLSAQLQAEALPMTDASRSEIITALHQARREIGLTRQQTDLLAFLASWTREDEWHSGGDPISIASNHEIGQQFDVGRTRVKSLLRGLAEAGWLIHRDSPNGHRYRRAHPSGRGTVYAYGLDMSPLSRRYPELKAAAAAAAERRREGHRLHYQVTALARRIYDLTQTGVGLGMDPNEATEIGQQAHAITLQRGEDRDPAQLSPLCDQLTELLEAAGIRISALHAVESDPMGSPECPHYTDTNPDNIITVKTEARSARYAMKKTSSRDGQALPRAASSPLRGFRAGTSFILGIAPSFRQYVSSYRPREDEIVAAALFASHDLGISRHAWAQASNVLGQYETAVAIAVISARQAEGRIRSPGGYLRAMIDRQLKGDLHLDRTLYGMRGAEA
ncbi:plasmid replication protein RepC [Bombella apis]|uniref:plasmid replication protein RepC n=1 Tax=Bombella apis TaxID=1785988 RepID=UPI0024A90CCE|nr:plasmid replication protein RepC [Bombella apis]